MVRALVVVAKESLTWPVGAGGGWIAFYGDMLVALFYYHKLVARNLIKAPRMNSLHDGKDIFKIQVVSRFVKSKHISLPNLFAQRKYRILSETFILAFWGDFPRGNIKVEEVVIVRPNDDIRRVLHFIVVL